MALAPLATCRRERPQPAGEDPGLWRELEFVPSVEHPTAQHAAVLAEPGAPLLVALHGRGEAVRGLVRGARGWRNDYALGRAHAALSRGSLVAEDFGGLVRPERLAVLNAALRAEPYRGLCVACPYTPALPDPSEAGARPFASFLLDQLIARVRRELGPKAGREATGIDGVSMGGRLALLVGLSHPEVFGAVGALQPAISVADAPWLAKLAAAASARAPGALRLVTSDADPLRPACEKLSERLRAEGVEHQLLVTPGPHDYVWNRGPGAIEMLFWHDRVLRGRQPT
ncbi:MAG: esterase [Deltaproteobacteria bacterium]|nr:esterase [Deltaproteobacteria bacterium]